MNSPKILGRYSIQHIMEELYGPIILMNMENGGGYFPPKYMYIRELIPVVLDLHTVQFPCWSTHFREAASANNLLHHIDPTIPTPLSDEIDNDTTLWCEQDAVVLTWIFATISPYLLMRLFRQKLYTITAMDTWARLRDMCQQHNITMQKKKRRFIHIDLNEDYRGPGDNDNYDDRVDLVSNLPDHLLIYILSLAADVKTAGRTSILSKRWTRLWTDLMDLDFNDVETTATLQYESYAQPEMDKFVDCVNQVITANTAPSLGTFRIHFPLHTTYAAHVDNWLKFAFLKKARNLELNFLTSRSRIHFFKIFSTDPALILNTTLESLHLKSVGINGPFLQWVITNCVNLQRLSLHSCIADDAASSRQHLVISSNKLKHLEFYHCLKLLRFDALHLSAPNLTSFIYYELENNVEYRSVPSLVDVTFGGSYFHYLYTLSRFSSQLEKLSILWDPWCYNYAFSAPSRFPMNSGFPIFINVQQLEIVCSKRDSYCLSAASLIEACPLMHTFKLKLMCGCGKQLEGPRKSFAAYNTQIKAIFKAKRSIKHLRTVEYLGYDGCAFAAELALCLTRHAPMLGRFIFDTRQPHFLGRSCEDHTSNHRDQMEIVRSETELLAEHIRGSQGLADVVIL